MRPAIRSNPTGTSAVICIEWAGKPVEGADGTGIGKAATAEAFALGLLKPIRLSSRHNAIGDALLEGLRLIEEDRITGLRRMITRSGDSRGSFGGTGIAKARGSVLAAGITANGPLILDESKGDLLAEIWRVQLIGGPGAVVRPANRSAGLVTTVRRNRILAIAGDLPTPDECHCAGSA